MLIQSINLYKFSAVYYLTICYFGCINNFHTQLCSTYHNNLSELLELTQKQQALFEDQLKELIQRVQQILVTEPNVISVPIPVQICGSLRGKFKDVLNLFKLGDSFEQSNYIFLGDYIGGLQSLEVITLIYLYKLLYPTKIYLLRGNHESRSMSQSYGFYDQCLKYYQNHSIWTTFIESFDYMPIAAMIDGCFSFLYIS
ncbi:Serine/threonine-protein_phosphatase [Hexamita inflata]|uniref:Serine/threonine-protein phosphatase n=1 Tax=Hexamita inflata TaxID=28002 RepID=A0ABP1K930_9EUKA